MEVCLIKAVLYEDFCWVKIIQLLFKLLPDDQNPGQGYVGGAEG